VGGTLRVECDQDYSCEDAAGRDSHFLVHECIPSTESDWLLLFVLCECWFALSCGTYEIAHQVI
jgi:hypothetical protein